MHLVFEGGDILTQLERRINAPGNNAHIKELADYGTIIFHPPDPLRLPREVPSIEILSELRWLEQNSPAWSNSRIRLGASAAAAALGVERYQPRVIPLLELQGIFKPPEEYRKLAFDQGHYWEGGNTRCFTASMREFFGVKDAGGDVVGILVNLQMPTTHASIDFLTSGSTRPYNPLFEHALYDLPADATLDNSFVEAKVYDRNELKNNPSQSYPVQMHQQHYTLSTQPWPELSRRKYM